jgi:SnoaL-like domain
VLGDEIPRTVIDTLEIQSVVSKAVVARDSGLWKELAQCYHPDATLTTSWFTGSPADFVTRSQEMKIARHEGESQKHITSNYWIEVSGARAVAECDSILYQRRLINQVEWDFTTWSRKLHLLEKREGKWRIWGQTFIYEKDRMDPARPDQVPAGFYRSMDLSKYPQQIRFHCWRNDMVGFPPAKNICLKGSEREAEVRDEARKWIAGE